MAGDAETGVTIHRTIEELDAGPIAAQRAFPIGPDDDAGAVYARAAEVAAELLDEVLPSRSFSRSPTTGATYAEKIAPEDRELDWSDPAGAVNRVRALSPHIGARAELHGRPVIVWRARRGRTESCRRRRRAGRGAARRRPAHDGRRVPPRRPAVSSRPPAGPPTRSSCASSSTTPTPTARSRAPPRGSTSATGRSRSGSRTARSSASARSTTRSRRSAGGRSGSSIRRCAPRCGWAPTSSASGQRRGPRGRERVGRARPPRPARARRAVHERGDAAARARTRTLLGRSGRHARGGCAQAVVPGLGHGLRRGSSGRTARSR